MLERLREVFRFLPNTRIEAHHPQVRTETVKGLWTARIAIIGGAGEFASVIQTRVNSLSAPFEFEWRRQSSKPWDWKLISVRNPALEISDL